MNQKDRTSIAQLLSTFEVRVGKGTTENQLLSHFRRDPLFNDSSFEKAYYEAKGWLVGSVDGWYVAIPPRSQNGGKPVNFKRTVKLHSSVELSESIQA